MWPPPSSLLLRYTPDMKKLAILQVADTGPLESLVVMLQSVGYTCALPSRSLLGELRRIGLDTVLDWRDLVAHWGYDVPMNLPEAGLADMATAALYVDVKAHRGYHSVVAHWPNLRGRVLWYRINGGQPEHVVNQRGDHGDEVNPPCPVLTPNQWYREESYPAYHGDDSIEQVKYGWAGRAYCMWPPFYRMSDYNFKRQDKLDSPICLIHNLEGWGYGKMVEPLRELGVRCHGVRSPDGLINHREVGVRLSKAIAMVHLKSNDAPGYALYEALASACPVICTRRLIWRCRMEELLIPGKTCLVFDRETHDGLSSLDVAQCTEEIKHHLKFLTSQENNRAIGEAGKARLQEVMWTEKKDKKSLADFFTRNFS